MTTDKKTIVLMGLIGLMGNTATAQELENEDSIRMEHIQEVVVEVYELLKARLLL